MFPQGGPGVALLLLRTSVVAFLIIIAVNYDGPFHRLILVVILLISTSLLLGLLTPLLCVIAAAFSIGNIIINPCASIVVWVIATTNAIALGLLGPGAYSIDSKLFGRRVTTIRSRNSSPFL
ncbi:MAG: hypothetical protein ND895_20900 [Pyrinomonadaceae bacterium]|nr:hypothetical protein [Pyrinomonadaceae bacterium]